MAGKKTKTTKSKKVVKSVEPVEPVEPVEQVKPVEPDPPVEIIQSVDPPVDDQSEFLNFSSEINTLRSTLKDQMNVMRSMVKSLDSLEKRLNKESKVAIKKMSGRKQKLLPNGEKPLNGFSKPGNVSDELRKFLGLGSDELIARVDVTKAITKYCNDNGLTNQADKRILLPDKQLSSLLRIDSSIKEDLTYFNLQKYLKIHFPNKEGEFLSL